DTRLLAQAYLERVAPVGSAIVQDWRPETYYYLPRLDPTRHRLYSLWSDPSLLHPGAAPADYYVFSSLVTERYGRASAVEERALVSRLERLGFVRVRLSPLRDGADILVELDAIYLPYRHLFQHERSGPTILIYARPGMPAPLPRENDGV
ncbi:MAG: hypothetical protein L0191_18640, partial [Acidobacteria bacterium]|nr:hypothetical protein [Acidobacteriota bacterium]